LWLTILSSSARVSKSWKIINQPLERFIMMCLLKRVLPFTLTLILGLMLGSTLSPRPLSQMKCSYYSNQASHSTPVIIRALPDATYTDAARVNRFEGTAYLYALCDARGRVAEIVLRVVLAYGLAAVSSRVA